MPLVIDILSPTMNPTILAIDGGGVRGVIPLEFLVLIQEHLGPSCPLQDLVDLAVGTSSGGLSTLGLFKMKWNARKCSDMFDRVARRIFHERRESAISRFFRTVFKAELPLAILPRWVLWLLHDGCYDSGTFDLALKDVFGDDHRIFGAFDRQSTAISGTRFGVVATSIAKDTHSCVFGNFNSDHGSTDNCEFKIVRPLNPHHEPLVWEAFFPTADIRDIGSFQDGGLRDNFAAGIARRLVRQVWPSRKHPARLLSIGTGAIPQPSAETPHFRHVFRDSFVRRGFDAWMASMDTDPKWMEMFNQLDEADKPDYFRFNVHLREIPNAIDSVEAMDDYRNLVILQAGSTALARDAAIAFLISRLYFVVEAIPETGNLPLSCRGTVRCKGVARQIITAIERLHPQRLDFITDSESLGSFQALEDVCRGCGRYRKAVSFFINHLDETVNIYLRSNSQKRWRINGFPDTVRSFILAQKIDSPFGQHHHGRAGIAACSECTAHVGPFQGKRRKRASDVSQQDGGGKRSRVA
ncbi:patatin-like phospholipase family protein [Aspergillus fischeri NRRL 181]|uniref:Phospholipase, patatin family protein n=1 Tax=Neosartorya fischeri (strain ATCC 1020 / DSM 3700 / CBS 544.65 / FGSC A1164 / JCM 1740 / NRRL 181 / WB 181) TaxID=331117 RepID=A1DA28_NEOFI|nr:phospholipase, patatin family protein [Aspergillus fischeri NRRL 181]EAW20659.1 phospholipase, patatin family protein [Aspergillus fischeri NRRL 181]